MTSAALARTPDRWWRRRRRRRRDAQHLRLAEVHLDRRDRLAGGGPDRRNVPARGIVLEQGERLLVALDLHSAIGGVEVRAGRAQLVEQRLMLRKQRRRRGSEPRRGRRGGHRL